jgi:hypothetical protein
MFRGATRQTGAGIRQRIGPAGRSPSVWLCGHVPRFSRIEHIVPDTVHAQIAQVTHRTDAQKFAGAVVQSASADAGVLRQHINRDSLLGAGSHVLLRLPYMTWQHAASGLARNSGEDAAMRTAGDPNALHR